jgi:hypothetical protein
MTRKWFSQSVLRLAAGAAAVASGGVVGAQEDVLRPDGPLEYIVRPFGDTAFPVVTTFTAAADDAAEQDAAEKDGATKGGDKRESPSPHYWLGVEIASLPDFARQQLEISDGLLVEDVADDSPAAKAEIKKNDILLTAGETPLKAPTDLLKAVEASQGKQMKVIVLRSGKKTTTIVTAARRPAAERVEIRFPARPELAGEIKRLEEALNVLKNKAGDGSLGLWFAKPGVVGPRIEANRAYTFKSDAAKAEFPKDLSVQITRQGDEPAKIHVKRGEKKWDVTEKTLGELPEEIRGHVKRYLSEPLGGGKAAMLFKDNRAIRVGPDGKVVGELRMAPVPPMPPRPPKAAAAPATPALPRPRAERPEGAAEPKLDIIIKKLNQLEDGTLQKLDKEIQQLRKDVDELRKKSGE